MSDDNPKDRYDRIARWTGLIQRAQLDAVLAEADREQAPLNLENKHLRAQLAHAQRRNDILARRLARQGETR